MNIFSQLMAKLKGPSKDFQGPVPGAQGRLLAQMGIHELGPHTRKGVPANVLGGCRKEVVAMPGTGKPALRKDGTPIYSKDKKGRKYLVMDQYGVTKRQLKQMLNDQKRKAEGRWYSGEPADVRAKRLKARAG